MTDFIEFPKMARLSRDIVVTEKLDGTNAQILITADGKIKAGSRTRWITPDDDNFGFAAWVFANKEQLLGLGEGRHFGEWWGRGIQRGYGLQERRFSLFNSLRWCNHWEEPQTIPAADPRILKTQQKAPNCCHVVPVLYRGIFNQMMIDEVLYDLKNYGSSAATGFMKPEGVVIYHISGNVGFKKTIEKDGHPKGII